MADQRDIKYINKEFGDLKQQLIEHAKNYFPDTYNDFSEASPGMMFIEMASYVGDVLAFYQDTQLQETFIQHAKNPANLYSLAYMMGYRPKVSSNSEVELTATMIVDATGSMFTPNWDQTFQVYADSTIKASTQESPTFLLTDGIDFGFSSSYDPTNITVYEITDGQPESYLLRKKVNAVSGEIKTYEETFTTAERFTTIEVNEENIIRVLSITDSDGEEWTEVPFLAQDTVFKEENNNNSDNDLVPSLLKLKRISKRFITRFTSKGVLQIQFGAGVTEAFDEEFLPDPTTIKKYGNKYAVDKLDKAYDPTNFLFTKTYGIAPSNTTLTVRYLVGGGVAANVPANTINANGIILRSTPANTDKVGTLAFTNDKPAAGGKDGDTIEELRENSLRSFAEQKRAVTTNDYTVRALSLPAQFGSIAKTFVTNEMVINSNSGPLERNPLALSMYTLAYNIDGHLIVATDTLKRNLKNYLGQYMMITDAIDMKDAFIVNIGVKFEILTLPNYGSRDVLLQCNNALREHFDIKRWNINQPINLSSVYTLLDQVKGVQTVKNIKITNKVGGRYSEYGYDTAGATKDNIVYPSYDPCIFELKYPDTDIEGRVTTL
jgi:hypothetical protein